ncbi:MAG: nicotinate phosphoribosyltransferase [Thiotrichaceae bacterium]|nr:nicotinate phosphoribosyltransferase [Thiotrichaceae bacterium]
MFTNIILNTDSYKSSHFLQYPAKTTTVSSYIESRGGDFKQTVFFGLQAFIKQYLLTPITQANIDEAEELLALHGVPFYKEGWQMILDRHQGFLPLEIEALPEGTVVATRNALVQVKNTDPDAYWLTSYIETALLRAIWYPTTVATVSWEVKQVIAHYLEETSDELKQLPFKLHDFGARGVSSHESAALGGMAHLVNFQGSDTMAGIIAARKYYGATMAGFSIPASEHSTMTSWGRDNEVGAYANMLDQFAQSGKLFAVVSDSYDIYHAVTEIWGKQLRQQIEESGATLIVRPDSGDPKTVVLEVLDRLYAEFGGRVNPKGYRVLADCVRVIQGDGVNLTSIAEILAAMKAKGYSAENIAFGMGGGLLQQSDRDTLRFAMKASAVEIDEQWNDIFKQPITDAGKGSKRGRLAVIKSGQAYQTIREDQRELGQENYLRVVYRDGELLVDDDFHLIRQRSNHE